MKTNSRINNLQALDESTNIHHIFLPCNTLNWVIRIKF